MELPTSTTGSLPPTYDPNRPIRRLPMEEQERLVKESIERAIRLQIELGISILVDGQVRADIVSMFCRKVSGFSGNTLPYQIASPIRPSETPVTVDDYKYALTFAGDHPVKAHLTGPMTLTHDANVDTVTSGYAGKQDRRLVLDMAAALGQEAYFLVQAGAHTVQIDEPVLRNGVDLDLAVEAMRIIIEKGMIPVAGLHICGNTTAILGEVIKSAPVQYVSLEAGWLRQNTLGFINRDYLNGCQKKLGLGCIDVANYTCERQRSVQDFLEQMTYRFGPENIWAVTPNCGMRMMPFDAARDKLQVMVAAASNISDNI